MSFNEDDELVSIIERGFNPLKSGQCLLILDGRMLQAEKNNSFQSP